MKGKIDTPVQALLDVARQHGELRTLMIVRRWQDAKASIAKDIADNDGLYPLNKGKVDVKEVCRRANISQQTLYAKTGPHRQTTLVEIQEWCKTLMHKSIPAVKKAVGEKSAFWKSEFEKVASQIHIYELQLIEKDLRIEGLCEEIRQLKKNAKIVSIHKNPR
ncbi:hypothetical protein [uncultured Herbaspirillum sp.]|uniref:hypothetical protein n=1 Tax=uncultured Herbaspirillum sp. TaxID=160236 RepID=UPI002590DC54|nr:hypothetical protein [uncultured Herbaspirillum sp.]